MKGKFLVLGFILAAISYSLTRAYDFSVWIKALPVLCCFLILLCNRSWSPRTTQIILIGMAISMLGDIALDLSATTLGIGIFTVVMSLYGYALYQAQRAFTWLALIPTLIIFASIYAMMYPHLSGRRVSAAIYQLVLIWMVWRGAALLTWKNQHGPDSYQKWFIFLGTLGIALNGVLYGVDLYLFPIPRDLVIQVYYLGQLLLVLGLIQYKKPEVS